MWRMNLIKKLYRYVYFKYMYKDICSIKRTGGAKNRSVSHIRTCTYIHTYLYDRCVGVQRHHHGLHISRSTVKT